MEFSTPDSRRPLIESYGEGGFRIDGKRLEGSVLLLPNRMDPWLETEVGSLTPGSFQPLLAVKESFDVLLVGTGAEMSILTPELRRFLHKAFGVWDSMPTGSACRTYNVLVGENRQVAAALLAV